MARTYDSIATTTLSSPAAGITFSNISQAYTDLILVIKPKLTSGFAQIQFTLNGDTGSNYSIMRFISGTSGNTSADNPAPVAFGQLTWGGYLNTSFNQSTICFINSYSNTNHWKSVVTRANNPTVGTGILTNTWRNNAAITSIYFYSDALAFDTGTMASLYGIKAA